MKSILIAGGNSGIGRHVAAELVSQGHRVVILGRDQRKGEQTLASFGDAAEHASFHAVDLSTHDGVRHAAERVLKDSDSFDTLVHTTGVMTSEDLRTTDGLHQVFAVTYLSRYHLTQLLMPALRRGHHGRVLMMTAHIPPTIKAASRDSQISDHSTSLRRGNQSNSPITITPHTSPASSQRSEQE